MATYYAHLEQEALLHITGPDALTFLQGQVTCDTRTVEAGQAAPGAYCTPQGRVVCDFLLCQLAPEHYAMRLRRDIRATSAGTFGKYIIFSKATLEEQRDDWQILACWGEGAAAALGEVFGAIPETCYGVSRGEGHVLVQTDQQGRQFECYLNPAEHAQLLQRLDEYLPLSTEAAWQALQISRGIGRVESATSGDFIPQMLNYDITGHVSFDKGCYTGQEVVARMHYRGKPKRRMYLGELTAPQEPAAGTPLYSSGSQQSVGNVVNSSRGANAAVQALVVATADGVEHGLHLDAPDGPLLTMRPLPYSPESN